MFWLAVQGLVAPIAISSLVVLFTVSVVKIVIKAKGDDAMGSKVKEFVSVVFDILYTMSSGQLSAILLAFSLALHKIFVNAGLNIMLIDDPVQCMDDLNIVSFVELIRTEFPNIQLLISTHENGFAGYIGYKYKKYNLPVQRCNLKEISTL